MPKADTSVKYFHSEMPGAPVISGTAGALIAALDACLINGFGLKTVDSLVVAGNVATANISTGHSAEKDTVVLIAGATPAELNGEWKVASTTTTTITFVTEGILDQTAAGSISLKLAAAGWAKPFSGTNKAVYQATGLAATGCLVQVDDTDTTSAKAVGYPNLSTPSTNSGTEGIPYPNPADGGLYLVPLYLGEFSSKAFRAVAPGLYCVPQVATGAFVTKDTISAVTGLPGKTLKAVQSYYTSMPNNMTAFFDITGPWR